MHVFTFKCLIVMEINHFVYKTDKRRINELINYKSEDLSFYSNGHTKTLDLAFVRQPSDLTELQSN